MPAENLAAELTQLAELYSRGLLTDAEFTAAKARILELPPVESAPPLGRHRTTTNGAGGKVTSRPPEPVPMTGGTTPTERVPTTDDAVPTTERMPRTEPPPNRALATSRTEPTGVPAPRARGPVPTGPAPRSPSAPVPTSPGPVSPGGAMPTSERVPTTVPPPPPGGVLARNEPPPSAARVETGGPVQPTAPAPAGGTVWATGRAPTGVPVLPTEAVPTVGSMQAAGRFDGRAIAVRTGSGWAKVAGVGAIVAAAGFVVATMAEHARQPGAGVWRVAPGWWGRQDLIGAVVVVVLVGCGVALLLRPPTARAAALVLAPAGALGAIFVSVVGLEGKAGTSRLAAGHWASVATAAGSFVCALAAALWLARSRWVRTSLPPSVLLVAPTGVVSAGLGVAGLLTTRYAGAGSVLHHLHGWYWISNIGVLVVIAAAPLAAALLSRVSPTAPIALGAALASLLLDRLFTSRVLLLARPFHPEAGWWLAMGGALACMIEAVAIAGPRQSDPYDAQRPRGGRHSVRRP